MLQAKLSQRSNRGGLGLGLVVLGLAWALSRQEGPGGPGPGPGPGDGNTVAVGASIGSIEVAQVARARQGGALMRRHLADKVYGSSIMVTIPFIPGTTLNGGSVTWPYRIVTRFGHNTTFGWRTSGDLGFSEDGISTSNINGLTGSPATLKVFFTAPVDKDQEWDIRVALHAAIPDALGSPTGEYAQVAEAEHPGAIRTVQGAVVSIAGSLGTVDAAQGGGCGCG